MSRTVSFFRKIIALIIGIPILVVGIILIPAPGPGLLISLLGLFILSLEFDWAKKHFDKGMETLKSVIAKAQNKR